MGDNYNNDYIEPAIDIADKYEDIMLFAERYMEFINPGIEIPYEDKIQFVKDVVLLTFYYGYYRYGKNIINMMEEEILLTFLIPRTRQAVGLHLNGGEYNQLFDDIWELYRVEYNPRSSIISKITFRDEEELREKMIAEMKRQRLWKHTPYTPNPRPEIGGRRRVRSRKTRTRRTRKTNAIIRRMNRESERIRMIERAAEYRMLKQDLIDFFERLKTEHISDINYRKKGRDLERAFRKRGQEYETMLKATLWYGLERYPHRRHLVWIDDALDWIKETYPLEFPEGPPIDTEMAFDPDPDIQADMASVRRWMIQHGYLRLTGGGRGRRRTITGRNKKLKRRTHRN